MNSTRRNLSSLNARSVLHEPSFSAQPLVCVCVVGVKCLCSQDSSSVPCITEVFPLQDAFSSLIRAEDFPSRTAFVQKVQRGRAQRSSNLRSRKQHLKVPGIGEGRGRIETCEDVDSWESDRDMFYVISESRANKADKKLWRPRRRRLMKASWGRQQDVMRRTDQVKIKGRMRHPGQSIGASRRDSGGQHQSIFALRWSQAALIDTFMYQWWVV